MVTGPRSDRRRTLAARIEEAYARLRQAQACEVPSGPAVTEATARDVVNPLRTALKRAGLSPPPPCKATAKSAREWFEYLGRLRAESGDHSAAEAWRPFTL